MKNPRLFRASLLLNLVLLGTLGWQLLSAPAPAPIASDLFFTAQPGPAPAFQWSQLEAGDYPTYIARLRTVGCPEETIRDLITADVTGQYEEKRRQLIAANPQPSGLASPAPTAEPHQNPPAPLTQGLQTLAQEQTALLAALLPPPSPAKPAAPSAPEAAAPSVPVGESLAASPSNRSPAQRAPQDLERQMRQRGVLTHEQELLRAKVGWQAFYYTTAEENAQERASNSVK